MPQTMSIRELNKKKYYTANQLLTLKKFQGKQLDVYPHHYEYWVDGKGYETVYEVRGTSTVIRENYQSPEEILGLR